MVYDKVAGQVRLYLDGVLESTRSYSGYPGDIDADFRAGGNKAGTANFLKGSMDDIAF